MHKITFFCFFPAEKYRQTNLDGFVQLRDMDKCLELIIWNGRQKTTAKLLKFEKVRAVSIDKYSFTN